MKPYQWMATYTPQKEWIERRGLLMWLAEVSGGIGAGLYLVALYFNNWPGMLLGWLAIVALKGGFHLAFLGKPLRFWRMLLRPQTSWMARGFIFMLLFILFGAVQLVLSLSIPGTVLEVILKVFAGGMAFLVAVYPGFVMNYINGIPFWNSALLPLLFVLTGVLDGLALLVAIGLAGGRVDILAAEMGSRILLITAAVVITLYLWSATYTGTTGKHSVLVLVREDLAPLFWFGVVFGGVILPVFVSVSSYVAGGEAAAWMLMVAVLSEMVGAFSLKYCVLKAGRYAPLIPVPVES